MLLFYYIVLLLSPFALANVEKTIFLGPPAISIPVAHPNLDDLSLIPLSPLHFSARTRLNASFPSKSAPRGTQHWFLLDGLSPGARYEVRICWLATVSLKPFILEILCETYPSQQPTAFSLHIHTLSGVFNDPELISSMSAYAYARQAGIDDLERQKLVARRAVQPSTLQPSAAPRLSVLFLQVFAAADYYTLNQRLMENVPPVLADIILDPYIFNVFPKSLLPTAGYILAVAIASWFLSGYIWQLIWKLVNSAGEDQGEKREQLDKKTS
jgi:hypothetical protein